MSGSMLRPLVLPLVSALAVLGATGVSPRDVLAYAAYWGLLVVAPGATLWVALTGRFLGPSEFFPRLLILVGGAALGYLLELVAYCSARALGAPRFWIAAPIVVTLVGAWRWWSRGTPQGIESLESTGAVRGLGLVVSYLILWFGLLVFPRLPLGAGFMADPDEMFHLALVGELRHHFPATYPYVEYPGHLTYQWFVHAHMASASWTTGIEAEILYRRFEPLILAVLAVVGTGVVAARLARSAWAAPLATGVLVLVGSFDVTGSAIGEAVPEDRFLQGGILVHSPTQTLAFAIAAPAVVLCLQFLKNRPTTAGVATLGALFALLSGSKVTFLPMFACGFLAVALVMAWKQRRAAWAAFGGAGLAALMVLLSGWLLYAGDSQSLGWRPLQTSRSIMSAVGVQGGGWLGELVVTGALLAMWLLPAAGAVGVLRRCELRWSPPVTWLLGAAASGYGATFLLGHGGNSQLYFGRSAAPLLAILSGWGLVELFRGLSRRVAVVAVLVSVASGAGLFLVRLATEEWRAPAPLEGSLVDSPVLRIWVNLPVVFLLAVIAWTVRLLARDLRRDTRRVTAVLVAALVGLGLARTVAVVVGHHPADAEVRAAQRFGIDGRATARTLRQLSRPNDVVATNVHCGPAFPRRAKECDARHFWMSALSERRFLLEGWAYTARSGDWTNPYFGDPRLLERNDGFFRRPTQQALESLTAKHFVSWVFVDQRGVGDVRELHKLDGLVLRAKQGSYVLFEVVLPIQEQL